MFRPYWIISRLVKYIKTGQLYVIIVIDLWLEVSSVFFLYVLQSWWWPGRAETCNSFIEKRVLFLYLNSSVRIGFVLLLIRETQRDVYRQGWNWPELFVCAFAKLWKAVISFVVSVRRHGTTDFDEIWYLAFSDYLSRKFKVWLKSDKNNGFVRVW